MSDLRDRIKEIIDTEDVVVFMKGTPQWAMCGNSVRALEALRAVEAPIAAVDVLPNPEYRKELTALSGWPTIPQVFVKGELIGGADIVQELVVNGELQRKLVGALGEDYRVPGNERTLALAATV
jgi:monothiol glutaredoxin